MVAARRRTALEGEAPRWSKEVGAGTQKPINWWKPVTAGTWNVRSVLGESDLLIMATDAANEQLALCGIQECGWEGKGRREAGDYV